AEWRPSARSRARSSVAIGDEGFGGGGRKLLMGTTHGSWFERSPRCSRPSSLPGIAIDFFRLSSRGEDGSGFVIAMRLVLPAVFVSLAACGAATAQKTSEPAKPANTAANATTASTEASLCDRVCTPTEKCGRPKDACVKRCLPIARVLQTYVVQAMVEC